MKLKKIITVGICGLIAATSVISNFAVHAEEINKVEIPVTVTGGTGTVEIKGNNDASELAAEGNQILDIESSNSFFVGYASEPCEYEYTVKETAVTDGYTKDDTEYTVHVFVAQEKEGLVPTVTIWETGTDKKSETVAFENKKNEEAKKDTSGKKSTDTSDSSKVYYWGILAGLAVVGVIVNILIKKESEKK